MKEYFIKLYRSRYFWSYLASAELRNKFRRSKLGILWTFISPLMLTGIMSVVFSTVFKSPIITYAPYILSGLLFWDLFSGSLIGGGTIFIANDGYIKQFNHPITIYTLKTSIVYTISFIIASISLIIWCLVVYPQNILLGLISLPLTSIIFFFISWACTTIAAFTNTKYRDYPQMMPLIMQTFWYLSPVFFQQSMFEHNIILYKWFNINPITHLLFLIRQPLLYGQFPTWQNYLISIIFTILLGFAAVYLNKINKKSIIFFI